MVREIDRQRQEQEDAANRAAMAAEDWEKENEKRRQIQIEKASRAYRQTAMVVGIVMACLAFGCCGFCFLSSLLPDRQRDEQKRSTQPVAKENGPAAAPKAQPEREQPPTKQRLNPDLPHPRKV